MTKSTCNAFTFLFLGHSIRGLMTGLNVHLQSKFSPGEQAGGCRHSLEEGVPYGGLTQIQWDLGIREKRARESLSSPHAARARRKRETLHFPCQMVSCLRRGADCG